LKDGFALSGKLKIYFDNAATTPPMNHEGLNNEGSHYESSYEFGNPSSPHRLGISAERAMNSARAEFSEILDCEQSELIFTSSGTESNNLAILGFALANKRSNLRIFTEPWEHPSIIEPIRFAEELGIAEGLVAPLEKRPGNLPGLVVISHVSHETGDINDVSRIAAALKQENKQTFVFVDGAQGFCKENVDLSNVDMYSFSGHKIHGASGFGGLFSRVRLVPFMRGGSQENGMRAGTENVSALLQTAHAAKILHAGQDEARARVSAVKAVLLSIKDELPDCLENAMSENVSPYILNMSFLGIKGETLVHLLSEKGIYASMGAACRSRKKQKSLLEMMGYNHERAQSAVRFSFSHLNTVQEASMAKEIIVKHVTQLRKILGGR